MPLTFEEMKEMEQFKHNNKLDYEKVRHINKMEELKLDLEIARVHAEPIKEWGDSYDSRGESKG